MAFLADFGIPLPTDGQDTDNWVNFSSGTVFVKVAGEWEPVFSAVSGNFFRAGAGVPDNALGINNDYYLNEITFDLYKKIAGVWVLVFRKGKSTAYYSGVGVPSILGGNGDHYLNQSTGDVYQYVDGAWTLVYSPGSSTIAPIEISTSASSYSYALAGKWLIGWEVKSDSAQTAKLGATPGGDEMGQGDTGAGGVWVGQGNMTETFTAQTIYFSNLTGNNDIKLWVIG